VTVTALPIRRPSHTSVLAFAPPPGRDPANRPPAGREPAAANTVSVTVDIALDAGPEADGLLRLVRELVDRGAGSVTITRYASGGQDAPAAVPDRPSTPRPRAVPDDEPDAVWIDAGARQVRVGGREITLTRLEFDLLVFFARHPRRVFSREHLLRSVWGYELAGPRTVDVHIRRLRGKLGDALPLVTTVYGVGYRLADGADVTIVGEPA